MLLQTAALTSVLLWGVHSAPLDSPRLSAQAGQHTAPHLLQHKSPLNIFYHSTLQVPNDTLRNNLSTRYVFSITSVFCNFVKLEMSLRGAGEKRQSTDFRASWLRPRWALSASRAQRGLASAGMKPCPRSRPETSCCRHRDEHQPGSLSGLRVGNPSTPSIPEFSK